MAEITQQFSVLPTVTHSPLEDQAELVKRSAHWSGEAGESPAHPLAMPNQLAVWGTSLAVHMLVLLLTSAVYFTVESQSPLPVLTTIIEDVDRKPLLQDLTHELDVDTVDPDAPIASMVKSVAETASNRQVQEKQLDPLVEDEMPPDPLAIAINDADLTKIVEGIHGEVVQTEGDVGSVDRLTLEIVRRLREKKVVVAWLMDASESLRMRREQVINRFDRVYKELDELTDDHSDALLTSVAAFGEQLTVMTKEPTADRETIQQAVRQIPVDESGIENVFTAIRSTALNHRQLARKGYEVMIVVLTDECGNDFEMLDDAVQQVKHQAMPVFVMGPVAPFGQHEIKIPWTDPETQEVYRLPVERGPESIRVEYPALPTWNEALRNAVLSSGFGSYGLAQVTRESGGIYFLHQDENVSGAGIDLTAMLDHSPDYVSAAEYMKLVRRHEARQAVLTATEASQKASWTQPKTKFLASGIQFDIRDDQDTLMKISQFLDQSIDALRSAEKAREQEASPRWRAHYDLLLGRLLANRVRLNNTIPLLNQMYTKPKPCVDGTTNAWELAGREGSSLRSVPALNTEDPPRPGHDKRDEQAGSKDENDVAVAHGFLKRVESEHPGTPWATLARLELDTALEFEWKETFMIPPEGERLPWDKKPWNELTDRQKEAKRKFERFQRDKRKKVEEQRAREAIAGGEKKNRIPKL